MSYQKQDTNSISLRRDVKLLGQMLGEVLVDHGGYQLFETVEGIRELAKALRRSPDPQQYERLKREIASLDPLMRKQVIRAFAVFFHLMNVAEQNHRIRRRRHYLLELECTVQPLSIESAVQSLKEAGASGDIISQALSLMSLELVITAHPTEATKRSILEGQQRIAKLLMRFDEPHLTKKEKSDLEEGLFSEVAILWQTDELRTQKPTVLDEVRSGLYYFEQTLFDVLPEIHREMEASLEKYYPELAWQVPDFLSFGSWVGGDRDGNPFVTHQITLETLQQHRLLAKGKYLEALKSLRARYSHASTRVAIAPELLDALQEGEAHFLEPDEAWPFENEVYRRFLTLIMKRVSEAGTGPSGYPSASSFIHDLNLLLNSLQSHFATRQELQWVQTLIRQAQLFGFHLAKLDIRNHSGEHETAIHEILDCVGICRDYTALSEREKSRILQGILSEPRPVLLLDEDYSPATREMIRVFQSIKEAQDKFGVEAVNVYLVSMTKSPSDLLEVMVLAKEAGLYRLHADGRMESRLDVVPLLETIEDLTAGAEIVETLFEMPVYARHLEARGFKQEIMLGYSDGSKDGGTLTANWKLYNAQVEIHEMAKNHGISLKFFHGRGGSLGRGGGPLNKSLLSQPPQTIGDGVKITEQGEVMSARYLLEDIAYRSLEQASSTLLETIARYLQAPLAQTPDFSRWRAAMEDIAALSYEKYQSLVFQDPGFLDYFHQATPLQEIDSLNIGSRPMKRKNQGSFADLRAIPWVFAWTQSRHLLPAWYAAGTGLAAFANKHENNLAMMREMYQGWPFFQSTIDNLQMALLKADLGTMSEYAGLVKDQETAQRILKDIEAEFHLTLELVLSISGDGILLEKTPNIRDSIQRRNPYIDPLNLIQVELIRMLRDLPENDMELLLQALLTISGISAGLRNTG